MRRYALFIIVCMLSLLVGVASASADNGPHVKGMGGLLTSACAGCHRAHTGKAADLLRANSVEALCYTCHGSSGTGSNLDVADGIGYPTGESSTERSGTPAALRGGGFKKAMINAASPEEEETEVTSHGLSLVKGKIPALSSGEPVTSSHSTNGTTDIAWGNGAASATENMGKSINLNCASCHDPHGNGNYRILRPIPEESGASAEVNITETPGTKKQYTTANYWETGEPNNPLFRERISEWCATCHTRLLTAPGENGTSNSGDAVYTYRHKVATREEWEKFETEVSEGKKKATLTKPSCIQCHVAHGTDATMAGLASEVTLPNGETPTFSEGNGGGESFLLRIDNRGTCEFCHNK